MTKFKIDTSSRGGRALAGVFALLLVTATFGPFAVGTAQAQSQTFERTFSGSPGFVTVDQTDISGPYTIRVYVDGSEIPDYPSGQTELVEWDSNGDKGLNKLIFKNGQIYSNVTVEVTLGETASGSPSFGSGAGTPPLSELIGNNGGDADLRCDTYSNVASFVTGGTKNVDCKRSDYPTIDKDGKDADQVKIDIYEQALTQKQTSDTFLTTVENYLEDTRTIALMEGKNAYIRALNNGTTKAVAESRARTAVYEYYATKQANLAANWNVNVGQFGYLLSTARNESGIANDFVDAALGPNGSDGFTGLTPEVTTPKNVTLVNGTTIQSQQIKVYPDGTADTRYVDVSSRDDAYFHFGVRDLPTKSGPKVFLNGKRYNEAWAEMDSQADQVAANVSTFVNGTYDSYQEGEINSTELIDPYLGAKEYSPTGGFQTWALSTFQSLGVDSPTNLSEIGHMTIVDNETDSTYRGILMSDGLPQNGTFEVGTTYDAANLAGQQFVVTSDEKHDLSGNFTVTQAVTLDGTNQTEVQYRNVNYETADIGEYQSLIDELAATRSALEEREQNTSSGGGGGSLPFGVSQQGGLAIAALAGAALYLFGANQD